MDYLVDTNCLLRLVRKTDPHRQTVLNAFKRLRGNHARLCYTPQVLAEAWNVMTRPATARGGLGLSIEEAERKIKIIEEHLVLLPDSLATFIEWRRLIAQHRVRGVEVHDAKLVASMITHGINHLLTFNVKDFERFSMVTTTDPASV